MKDHPYKEEVKYSLELLNSEGFKPIGYDDGEGELTETTDINEIIEGVLSVDESTVDFDTGDGIVSGYFVLGNEPGVAIADYSAPMNKQFLMNEFEKVCNKIYDHFNPLLKELN